MRNAQKKRIEVICLVFICILFHINHNQTADAAAIAEKKDKIMFELNLAGKNIFLGEDVEKLKEDFGNPNRIDKTEYDYENYIYNNTNYDNFFMAGIKEGKIVALYTDAIDFSCIGLTPLMQIEQINDILKTNMQLQSILMYQDNSYQLFLLIDKIETKKLVGIQVISNQVNYTERTKEVMEAWEKELFDCVNSARVRKGKHSLVWDEKTAQAARKHSEDMVLHKYFHHNSLEGISFSQRMRREDIAWSLCAENIIKGYPNAIFANHGWYNSRKQRKNMLSEKFNYLGIGGALGTGSFQNEIYFTENFWG